MIRTVFIFVVLISFILVLFPLGSNSQDKKRYESRLLKEDSFFINYEFIEIGKEDTLYFRYCSFSDSGVLLERVTNSNVKWLVFSEPLYLSHLKYHHKVYVEIKGSSIHINSQASGGNFQEIRELETGDLIRRSEINE